jgi:hypothetical protein
MPIRLRLVLPALATLLVLAAAPAAHAKVNKDPRFLEVYDANVENLPNPADKCPARWQGLVAAIKARKVAPDVLTVEQLSGTAQANAYAAYLSQQLGGSFVAIVAKASPKPMKSPCGKVKRYQTNAIFYRPGRLEPIPRTVGRWQADHLSKGHCRDNTQDRSIGVRQLFLDKRANRFVTIGVTHWPTAQSHGTPCATENARETISMMGRYGSDLRIFGGDFNVTPTRGGPWYARLTGKHHYGDAICPQNTAICSAGNYTSGGGRRIDMLFAKRGDGSPAAASAAHTITTQEAGGRYSDHRAILARVHY